MSVQQKITFQAGINSDLADELMPPNQGRYRLNVRVMSSNNSTIGAVETVNGNTAVPYTLPAGNNVCIGYCEDLLRKKAYAMLFNDAGTHSILQYDEQANTIQLVFQDITNQYLNFKLTNLITGINVVNLDSNNNLLYWTDNYVNPADKNIYNEPKKINIEKGIAFSISGGALPTSANPLLYKYNTVPFTIDPLVFFRIKQPPLYAPTYAWSNNNAQLINHLFKKLFIFKVQFVYDDKEISAWSPICNYKFPATTIYSKGTGEDYQFQDNTITLTIPTGNSIVTRIRIAAQQLGVPDFSLIADLNKEHLNITDNSSYNYVFINDGNYVTLEINESIKLFDNVPLYSKSQELIQGIRLTDGLITENQDAVAIDMKLPLSYVEATFPSNAYFPNRQYLKSGGIYKYCIVYYDKSGNRSGLANTLNGKSTIIVPGDNRYGTTLYIPFLTDPLYGAPNAPDAGTQFMTYIPQVDTEIYNHPPSWASHYQILRSRNEAMTKYLQFVGYDINYTDIDGNSVAAVNAFYCLINIGNISGRYKQENPNSNLVYDFTKGDRVRFIANVNGFGIDHSSNTIDTFFAFNDTEIISYNAASGNISIAMTSDVPLHMKDFAVNLVLLEIYTPAASVINDNELVYEISEEYDLGTDIHGNLIHKGGVSNQLITPFSAATYAAPPTFHATVPIGHGLLVNDLVKVVTSGYSVYGKVTILNTATTITIITSSTLVGIFNGSLAGEIIKAATSTLSSGDCFRRYQNMPAEIPPVFRLYMYVEAQNASNLFISNADDYGRPNRIDPEIGRIIRPSTIYYSEKLIPETDINGLSSVFDTNFETYEAKWGGIYKMYNENLRLQVFQELKIGAVLVNQIIYNDLQLNNTVGASSQVLSPQIVYYAGEFGIGKEPESFAIYGNAKYGIDIRRGVVWRLSNDGLVPISEYGMHNYFNDKCREILAYGSKVNIYGTFDIRFGEYIIAFSNFSLDNNAETLAFNERENAWSTYYSYKPEFMGMNGIDIISFLDGFLYTHNTNTNQNTFYGTTIPSELWMIGNLEPSKVKVLQAISQETNRNWVIPSITTPDGQETKMIFDSNWVIKENNQYAFVKMDKNTVNVSDPIINGNVMRDRTFLIKLAYFPITYNKLFAVNLYYIGSERSNK